MKKTQLSLLIAALLTGANLYADDKAVPAAPAADAKPAEAAPAPKADAPKADAPKADAPKADAPKADAPKADAPKADAPKADAKKAVDLTGNWASTHGGDLVTIEQKGDKVTATYEYAEDSVMYVGKIEGTLKDKTVEGKWSEKPKTDKGESSNGSVELTIVDDKTLLGKWRSEGTREWEGDWNLEKK